MNIYYLKNGPNIVNSRSDITSMLYFWKTVFKDYLPIIISIVYKHIILITKKLYAFEFSSIFSKQIFTK